MCGCGGSGIEIFDLRQYPAEQLRNKCMKLNATVEEIIKQHEEIAALHLQSIDTIRLVTI